MKLAILLALFSVIEGERLTVNVNQKTLKDIAHKWSRTTDDIQIFLEKEQKKVADEFKPDLDAVRGNIVEM